MIAVSEGSPIFLNKSFPNGDHESGASSASIPGRLVLQASTQASMLAIRRRRMSHDVSSSAFPV
jgi:hypothetical protein